MQRITELKDWNLGVIKTLVNQGYNETDWFDFKLQLPIKSPSESLRLRKTICSFANADGGFLIYGISDKSAENGEARIQGIDSNQDFFKLFGDIANSKVIEPSVPWTPLSQGIALENGKTIHVIHIPSSKFRPHAVVENGSFEFFFRSNGANTPMSYSYLRNLILNTYEKEMKLKILMVELENFLTEIKGMITQKDNSENRYTFHQFNLSPLENIMQSLNAYEDINLLGECIHLRISMHTINLAMSHHSIQMSSPRSNLVEINLKHKVWLEDKFNLLQISINKVIYSLEVRFKLKVE